MDVFQKNVIAKQAKKQAELDSRWDKALDEVAATRGSGLDYRLPPQANVERSKGVRKTYVEMLNERRAEAAEENKKNGASVSF